MTFDPFTWHEETIIIVACVWHAMGTRCPQLARCLFVGSKPTPIPQTAPSERRDDSDSGQSTTPSYLRFTGRYPKPI